MTLNSKWAKQSEKKRQSQAQQDRTRKRLLVRSIAAATTFTFFSPMIASADIISGNDAITSVTKDGNIYTVESLQPIRTECQHDREPVFRYERKQHCSEPVQLR